MTKENYGLSWERIGDQICAALESGDVATFGWDDSLSKEPSKPHTIPDEYRDFPHIGWALGSDGYVLLCDRHDNWKAYRLDREKLSAGLVILREKHPAMFADIIAEQEDFAAGDALVQCAVFGEWRYS